MDDVTHDDQEPLLDVGNGVGLSGYCTADGDARLVCFAKAFGESESRELLVADTSFLKESCTLFHLGSSS